MRLDAKKDELRDETTLTLTVSALALVKMTQPEYLAFNRCVITLHQIASGEWKEKYDAKR